MAWWAGRGSRRNRRATFSWPTSPSGSTTPDTCLRPRAREFSKRSRLLPPRKSRMRSRYTMQAAAGGAPGREPRRQWAGRPLSRERKGKVPVSGTRHGRTASTRLLVATPPRQRQGPASPDTCGWVRAGVPHGTWHALTWSAAAPPRNAVTNCGGVATVCSPCPLHGPTTMDLSFRRLRRVSAYEHDVTMIIS